MDADSMHNKGGDISPSPIETPISQARENNTSEVPAEKPQAPNEAPHAQPNSAGVTVLQWLTYAFWGWLILGLLWLMSVILINAILGESVNESVPYAIAATIVLLPLAFFCDLFYRKREQPKKAGAAMVIMVIHAVLFAVLGIISLIIAVFIGINMLINTGDPVDSQTVGILVAAFAALLYAGAFLRTLSPFKSKKPTFVYGIAMAILTVTLLIFAVVGPVVTSLATRGDRVIEASLPDVQNSIDRYITQNKKLPSSLNDVTFNDDEANELAKSGDVEYKAEGKVAKSTLNELSNLTAAYRYQLCVEYKAEKNNESSRNYSNDDDDGYTSYLSTHSHDAGRTCYKLQQTVYGTSLN